MCNMGKKVCEILEFELLKAENSYCEIVDLVAATLEIDTYDVNMFEVVKATRDNKTFMEILEVAI